MTLREKENKRKTKQKEGRWWIGRFYSALEFGFPGGGPHNNPVWGTSERDYVTYYITYISKSYIYSKYSLDDKSFPKNECAWLYNIHKYISKACIFIIYMAWITNALRRTSEHDYIIYVNIYPSHIYNIYGLDYKILSEERVSIII